MSGDGVQIRRLEINDVDRVMAIAKSLQHAPRWPRDVYTRALDPESEPIRIALVAESLEMGVIGFAITVLIPPQAELETIAVAAKAQRRGVPRRIFGALVDELRKAQITEVMLEVRASNEPALELYRSLGFGPTGIRRCYYAEPQEDAIMLSLALDGRGAD